MAFSLRSCDVRHTAGGEIQTLFQKKIKILWNAPRLPSWCLLVPFVPLLQEETDLVDQHRAARTFRPDARTDKETRGRARLRVGLERDAEARSCRVEAREGAEVEELSSISRHLPTADSAAGSRHPRSGTTV